MNEDKDFDISGGILKKYLGSASSVTIPDSVTTIGNSAFQGCTSLTSVTIPEGVRKIDGYAFSGCSSLPSVSIPASVTEIGWSAFEGCTALTEIHYGGSREQWAAVVKREDWNKGVPATEVLVHNQ